MNLFRNDHAQSLELQPYPFRWFLATMAFFAFYFLLAVRTSFYISAGIIVAVPVLFLIFYYFFKIPGLAIGMMIAATSLDVVGRLTGVDTPLSLTVFHLMFFLALIIVVLKKLWFIRSKIITTDIDLTLVLFLLFIGISIFWTHDREEAFISFGRLIALVIGMYVTLNLIESKASLTLITILVFISALALSLYAAKDFLTSSSVQVKNALSMLKLFSRFGATFDNPNYFATFLLLPLSLAFSSFAFLKMAYAKKIMYFLIPSGIFLIALVGTFSRSAWIALFISYLYIFSYFKNKKYWTIAVLSVMVVAVIALFQTAFFQSFVLRFATIFEGKTDPSSATRLFLINGGIQMFFNSWFLGTGFESFPFEYPAYMPPNQMLAYVKECHTLPVEILAELGIAGLLLFLLMVFQVIKTGVRSVREMDDNFLRTFQIGLVAFFIGLMINFLFMPGGILNNFFWISIGMIFGIKNISESGKAALNEKSLPV